MNDPLDEFFKIFSAKWLCSLKAYIHHATSIQFLEESEPFSGGQILSYIPWTAKMAAVRAPQITSVRDGQIN
jgi:hypothetical protein